MFAHIFLQPGGALRAYDNEFLTRLPARLERRRESGFRELFRCEALRSIHHLPFTIYPSSSGILCQKERN